MNLLKKILVVLVLMVFALSGNAQEKNYAIAIHGGAGFIKRSNFSPEREKQYTEKLQEALNAAEKVVKEGGKAIDAVCAAIVIMENSPLFNAGKGAVFTADGKNELDASIMQGSDFNAGAVANVTTVKNPILAAKEVLFNSPHVLLVKEGAEKFALERKLEIVKPEYFKTQKSWKRYKANKKNDKHGTVGCVVLDTHGNLAAGTSTGGMSNKKWGRVGDSPIIGAGTYANNASCAVSATGHGEFFIRNVVAFDISALMLYKGLSLNEAADFVINKKLKEQKANGGVVCVDKDGNVAMPFNTPGMFRAYVKSNGETAVLMFKE